MRFLEKRPEWLFADILQREESYLPLKDRMYRYGQAPKVAARGGTV